MKTVLIVEDHNETRNWWTENIGKAFQEAVATGASTLEEARAQLAEQTFALALVDINLPDGSGIDLVRDMGTSCPETYCVITTIFDDDAHIFTALQAGARGYLIKDQPRKTQIQQLRAVLEGQPPLSPGVARRILEYFSLNEKGTEEYEPLTPRENDVLQLIAKGFSRPEVAKLLGLTTNTVASYTKTIYQKLNVSSRAEAVYEGLRLGLIDPY